ncbi:DUF1338 family protein [Salmonella enterica subsp. enterica]|nr:DUF1338 family protein [Salmonella enterica subsp. enterica]
METFRWHRQATVDEETYRSLHREHRLIADVCCFPGCHISHLTPRHSGYRPGTGHDARCGITPKKFLSKVRLAAKCYSVAANPGFKALEEQVLFVDESGYAHGALRRGEQRGVALTPKGRQLYDELSVAQGGNG